MLSEVNNGVFGCYFLCDFKIIRIKNVKNGATMTYQLVAENEADVKTGKISVKSPIAQGLLGKSVGDKTEIDVPVGKMEFEILEISR